MRQYQHSVRIYHKDTDSLGIVHHSNYLVYFEQARTEALRSLGIELPLLLEHQGIQFVVATVDIKYSKYSKLDDILVIVSKVYKVDKYSVLFNQQAFKSTDLKKSICKANIRLAIVDVGARLHPLPKSLQEILL